MKLVRFLKDFFHVDGSGNTAVKYAQGETYAATLETVSQVAAGAAEVVTAQGVAAEAGAAEAGAAEVLPAVAAPAPEGATEAPASASVATATAA